MQPGSLHDLSALRPQVKRNNMWGKLQFLNNVLSSLGESQHRIIMWISLKNSLCYTRGEREKHVFFSAPLLCNKEQAIMCTVLYIVYVLLVSYSSNKPAPHLLRRKGLLPVGGLWLGRVPPPGYKWWRRDLEEGRRESADAKILFTCSRDLAYAVCPDVVILRESGAFWSSLAQCAKTQKVAHFDFFKILCSKIYLFFKKKGQIF